MRPAGSELSVSQLVTALLYKLTDPTAKASACSELTFDEFPKLGDDVVTILSRLRALRNTLSPINRLPPETLATILRLVQNPTSQFRPRREDWPKRHWLSASLVCRYWRDTAFAFGNLWSDIVVSDGRNTAAAQAFLERSAAAPLNLYFLWSWHHNSGLNNTFLAACNAHSDRYKSLHLLTSELSQVDWDILNTPAPQLETLAIGLYDAHLPEDLHDMPTLFAGVTPRLRRLALSYYSTWTGNTFSGLTHLSLHRQASTGRPTLNDFLDFLAASPYLQDLALIDAGPDFSPEQFALERPRAPLPLPSLRALELGDWPSVPMLTTFLAQLEIPAAADVQIWGQHDFIGADDLSPFFAPLSMRLTDPARMRTIYITSHHCMGRRLLALKDDVLLLDGEIWPAEYLPLLRLCALQDVEQVWLSPGSAAENQLTLEACRELFTGTPRLTALGICRFDPHIVLSSLIMYDPPPLPSSAASAITTNTPPGVLLCPRLEKIALFACPGLSKMFMPCFAQERARYGLPLRTLHITGEPSSPGEQVYLQKHIKEVMYVDNAAPEYLGLVKMDRWWPTPAAKWL